MAMQDSGKTFNLFCNSVLWLGIAVLCFPIYYAVVIASMEPGTEYTTTGLFLHGHLLENIATAWNGRDLALQIFNSFVMAAGITIGKVVVSVLSAYAFVYFRFRFQSLAFLAIFMTLMLPVEVRITPTYEVVANLLLPLETLSSFLGFSLEIGADWSLLDSYSGLILPLIASATGTFLLRQFFLTMPAELSEAAKIDGAGPIRFFVSILLPMARTPIAALSVILFIYGWNQYLWPLLITTDPSMTTALIGMAKSLPAADAEARWSITMAAALIVTLPPVLVVIVLQRWFVRGLVDSEK
jgi:sn-glycerol 3-phosphate transport system permease protein